MQHSLKFNEMKRLFFINQRNYVYCKIGHDTFTDSKFISVFSGETIEAENSNENCFVGKLLYTIFQNDGTCVFAEEIPEIDFCLTQEINDIFTNFDFYFNNLD